MKKAIFNWSGGKDSSLALFEVLKSKEFEIVSLLTTVNLVYQRISMHGVRVELLRRQAEELGLPLTIIEVPEMPSMEDYNRLMRENLTNFKDQGAEYSIFGDIFLEDLKEYRDNQLAKVGIKGFYPIWKQSTEDLALEFVQRGFKSVTVCVNDKFLSKDYVGREMTQDFFDSLPDNVDPCGENGEYHSFVYDGPIYQNPMKIEKGEIVFKKYEPCAKEKEESDGYDGHDDVFDNGFWYCDYLLKKEEASI